MMDMYQSYPTSHALHDSHIQHLKSDDGLTLHTYRINLIYESVQTKNFHDMEYDSADFEQRDEPQYSDEVPQIYYNTIIHELPYKKSNNKK